MLDEYRSAGVTVAGVRLAGHWAGTELGACIDAETQALLAHLVTESLEVDLQQVRGLHTVRGKSPAGGCDLLNIVAAVWRKAYRCHMVVELSLPIQFHQGNIVFKALLFVFSIISRVHHIVDHPKVLNQSIIGGAVVVQLPQANYKFGRIKVWVQSLGLRSDN